MFGPTQHVHHFRKQLLEIIMNAGTTDEVHNGLATAKVTEASMRKCLDVANLALRSLANIDDNS